MAKQTTTATVTTDPAKLTRNPSITDDIADADQGSADDRSAASRPQARVVDAGAPGGQATVEVTGLHDEPLVFSMPAGVQREHLDSLLANVVRGWQRPEDRKDLIGRYSQRK